MVTYETILNAFVTMMVTIDPPGLAPIFLSLTIGMTRDHRKQVAIRGCLIAFCILVVFALFGKSLLSTLGITLSAFRVAGGLLLFLIALDMIFDWRNQHKEKSAQVAITRDMIHNIAAFPLAIPLIAGPGSISATLLLSARMPGLLGQGALLAIFAIVCFVTYLVLILAERIDRILGETGRSILTRLLGLVLAALAVQFVADGALELFRGTA